MRKRNKEKTGGAGKVSDEQIKNAQEPEIKDINEIYKDGVLLNLSVQVWSVKTSFPSDLVKDEFSVEEKNLISSRNKIISDDKLWREVDQIGFQSRVQIGKWSLDFPVRGLRFVRKVHVIRLNEYLKEQQKLFYEKGSEFINELFKSGGLVDQFKKDCPRLYELAVNKGAYPTEERIKSKFSFSWTWRKLNIPESNGTFSPEMVKEEIEKAKIEISEMKSMTMRLVQETLLKRITTLKEQCAEDKVNGLTIKSWNSWLEKFDELWSDFVWRPDLRKVVEEVKIMMGKVSGADVLKENEKFRNKIEKELGAVVKQLTNLPEIKSKRAFDL